MFMDGKVQYHKNVKFSPKLINRVKAITIKIPIEWEGGGRGKELTR